MAKKSVSRATPAGVPVGGSARMSTSTIGFVIALFETVPTPVIDAVAGMARVGKASVPARVTSAKPRSPAMPPTIGECHELGSPARPTLAPRRRAGDGGLVPPASLAHAATSVAVDAATVGAATVASDDAVMLTERDAGT